MQDDIFGCCSDEDFSSLTKAAAVLVGGKMGKQLEGLSTRVRKLNEPGIYWSDLFAEMAACHNEGMTGEQFSNWWNAALRREVRSVHQIVAGGVELQRLSEHEPEYDGGMNMWFFQSHLIEARIEFLVSAVNTVSDSETQTALSSLMRSRVIVPFAIAQGEFVGAALRN